MLPIKLSSAWNEENVTTFSSINKAKYKIYKITEFFNYFHDFILFWGAIFWHCIAEKYFMIWYLLEYSIMIRFKFLVRTWGHWCMKLFDGSRNVLWPLFFLLVRYMSVDYKYIKFLWVKVYVLAKIILDRSKKRWKLPFFVDNFLKPWKSSPKILFAIKPASYLFVGLNYITWTGKKWM